MCFHLIMKRISQGLGVERIEICSELLSVGVGCKVLQLRY